MVNSLDRPIDNYFKFIIIFLLFLLLAFDRDLAMIYLLILFGDWVWFKSDNFISFPLSRGSQTNFRVYLESLAGLGLFLAISSALVTMLSPQSVVSGGSVGPQAIFHMLSTSTPILQGSKFLTLLGWGLMVPIIETSFFNGRLLEGFATYTEELLGEKVPLDLNHFTLKLAGVIFVVAALFTLFHITAKGLASIPLLITFIFSVISSILVLRHKELKGAILIHAITNSLAVLASFGWF